MKYGQKQMTYGFAVVMALAFMTQVASAKEGHVEAEDEYPLKTCVVSGDKLDEMGEPYIYEYEGQEIRFCCEDCVNDFLKKPEKYLAKLQAAKDDSAEDTEHSNGHKRMMSDSTDDSDMGGEEGKNAHGHGAHKAGGHHDH